MRPQTPGSAVKSTAGWLCLLAMLALGSTGVKAEREAAALQTAAVVAPASR